MDFPKIIDWIFIIGWLFLAFFYIVISFLIKLFERNSAELITLLQILKVEETVNSSLKLFKVSFTDSRSNSGIFFSKTITINEQSTLLIYYGTNLNLSSRPINDIVKGSNQLNISEIVLLPNTELTEKAGKFVEQNKEQLTLLIFKDEEDLKLQLMKQFYDK